MELVAFFLVIAFTNSVHSESLAEVKYLHYDLLLNLEFLHSSL